MQTPPPRWSASADRLASLAAFVTVLSLLAGCQGAATASPTAGGSTAPTVPGAPTATQSPEGSSGAGRWLPAGTMTIGREVPHAVLLGDGRVLVIGNDLLGGYSGVPTDSATAELSDPAAGTWRATGSLNRPRGEFVALPLADGRVLVTGGLTQGAQGCGTPGQQSYSSSYVYDPRAGGGVWTRAGLLGTARAAPAAAVLPDGRVLVAGGSYQSGAMPSGREPAPAGVVAAYRPGAIADREPLEPRLNDVTPPTVGVALATAELFDPTTGTWSATGPLRYARFGAAAVTLADGRVLVVGSRSGSANGVAKVADQASVNAEIYDPKAGRFSLTGSLPAVDLAALAKQGIELPDGPPEVTDVGTLVALADGGAILVGNGGTWKHQGDITRSFRFDAGTGRWHEIGQVFAGGFNAAHDTYLETPGVNRLHALAARLPDGRVLVAGGDGSYQYPGAPTRTAELYDPPADAWAPLPPMPEGRTGGAAVVLKDGSVLFTGGFDAQSSRSGGCIEPRGLVSAIRFVPSP